MTRAFGATDPATRREARLIRTAHPGIATVVDHVLARRGGVSRLPGVGVLVGDPEACRAVLVDTARFGKTGPGSPGALWTPVVGPRVLFNMDGPEHVQLRRSVSDLFTPGVVLGVGEQAAEPVIRDGIERLEAGEPLDVARLALDVAASVIAEVIGLGPAGRLTVIHTSSAVERMVTWRTKALTSRQQRRARELVSVVADAAEATYRQGGEGTVMGRLRALGLPASDARSLAVALFLSGTSTVSAGLPRVVDALGDLGLLARGAWSASGLGIDQVVAEGLRLTAPSLVTTRRTLQDSMIGDMAVSEGERVIVLLWWALRLDGGFDPTRALPASMRSLWFGAGSHFCMGAPLATHELALMVGALTEVADRRGLQVLTRTPARKVLIPRYKSFVVATR